MEGAVDRVRPKLMTVATTMIGLLPILFGTETGTRVMKRIAAPMVGGLVTSTALTLVILPALRSSSHVAIGRLGPRAASGQISLQIFARTRLPDIRTRPAATSASACG